MEEKKLTDDEIVKALEEMASDCPANFSASVLDLIHRLQSENAEQKEEIERLHLAVEGITAENKVLHKENDELINDNELKTAQVGLLTEQVEYLKMCGDNFLADYQKAQAKVDELTEERENMQAEIIATEESRLQAVKNTSREIYEKAKAKSIPTFVNIDDNPRKDSSIFLSDLKNIVREKGVEVK